MTPHLATGQAVLGRNYKSFRGFVYFITSFIFSVLLFCQVIERWRRATSQLHFALTHKTQERWVNGGCHALHPFPLLSLGRSLCSFFLISGYSPGRANEVGIFFKVIFCIVFPFVSVRKKSNQATQYGGGVFSSDLQNAKGFFSTDFPTALHHCHWFICFTVWKAHPLLAWFAEISCTTPFIHSPKEFTCRGFIRWENNLAKATVTGLTFQKNRVFKKIFLGLIGMSLNFSTKNETQRDLPNQVQSHCNLPTYLGTNPSFVRFKI